jgi:SOS-response transcriptional repressor LexA
MKNITVLSPVKQRFFKIFNESGMTQKEFAGRLGKSQNQISAILNDRSNVSGDMIQLLRYKFNVNPDFILHGEKPMFLKPQVEGPVIPILTNIPTGDWHFWRDSNASGITEEYIAVPGVQGEYLFAVRVQDDSMQPRLQKGDILVIDPQVLFESGIAVVQREEGYMVRTVRKFGDRWILVPLNEIYGITEIISGAEASFYVPIKLVCVRDFPNE